MEAGQLVRLRPDNERMSSFSNQNKLQKNQRKRNWIKRSTVGNSTSWARIEKELDKSQCVTA
jgi:hypothetical protein